MNLCENAVFPLIPIVMTICSKSSKSGIDFPSLPVLLQPIKYDITVVRQSLEGGSHTLRSNIQNRGNVVYEIPLTFC